MTNKELAEKRLVAIEDHIGLHENAISSMKNDISSLQDTISSLRLRIADFEKKNEEDDF